MNICFNGTFLPAGQPVLTAQNRGFKWGDGLFETMKFHNGKLLLADLHFERLFKSLQLLQIETPSDLTNDHLQGLITMLCEQNGCSKNARVRLAIFRNDSNQAEFLLEAVSLGGEYNEWQAAGISLALYPYARKAMDTFSNIKSANFLPYVLAQKYAADNYFDDAVVLNAQSLLCDTSKANLFLVKDKQLFTPALHQGCVNGVMRRVVIEEMKRLDVRVSQEELSVEDLLRADEVFLTNAIQTIRWVKSYKDKTYSFSFTKRIFEHIRTTIFQ